MYLKTLACTIVLCFAPSVAWATNAEDFIAKIVPTYSRAFIDFVRNKQLKFRRIVGNYRNNNISEDVMNKTYDAMM